MTSQKLSRMKVFLLLTLASSLFISCTRTVYIVRHAEKATAADSIPNMSATDPPLSAPGKVRALVLKDELGNKKIKHIYSTNYIRTRTTAEPLSKFINVDILSYRNNDSVVNIVKALKGNTLIVGHSNTVDDLVNKLTGKNDIPGDLKDHEYDNLFIIKFKGKKAVFERKKFGYPSNP